MSRILLLSILFILASPELFSQKLENIVSVRGRHYLARAEVIDGDTVQVIDLAAIYVFKDPIDRNKHARLIRNVKAVYPYAKEAGRLHREIEENLKKLGNKRAQERYLQRMEDEIIEKYTPILYKMSFSQGKILIKLIDRETEQTSYTILRDMRGGFSAFFWQSTARLFGANLKEDYDKDGEDKIIEQIIILYEAGIL